MRFGKAAWIGILCTGLGGCAMPAVAPPVVGTQNSTTVNGLPQQIPYNQHDFNGVVNVPATTSTPPPNDTITLITSQTPFSAPPALQDAKRAPASGTPLIDLPLVYFELTASGTTVFASQPSFSVNIPPAVNPVNGPFFVAFYDPTAASPAWAFGLEGPGVVSGSQVTFTAPPGALTLQAGVHYYYAVYQLVSAIPTVSIGVSPSSLTLNGMGAGNAKTATINETGYAGTFTESDTCSSVATIALSSSVGPTSTVTVTGLSSGNCVATFTDGYGQQAKLNVAVTVSGFFISSH